MDPSGPCRKAFDADLPHSRQVTDPFGVVRHDKLIKRNAFGLTNFEHTQTVGVLPSGRV